MKKLSYDASAFKRAAALAEEGAVLPDLIRLVERLQRGQPLPEHARDHDLCGPLKGFRSCVVGFTADERNVVMVYRLSATRVHVLAVDEHDASYEIAIDVRRRR